MCTGQIGKLTCNIFYTRWFEWFSSLRFFFNIMLSPPCFTLSDYLSSACFVWNFFFLWEGRKQFRFWLRTWAMVSWCLWLGFWASLAAADGDQKGCSCGSLGDGLLLLPPHPSCLHQHCAILAQETPWSHGLPPCLHFYNKISRIVPLTCKRPVPRSGSKALSEGRVVVRSRPGSGL